MVARVAVSEKIIGLTLILDFFDRCRQIDSLNLPPAALVDLAQSKRSTKLSHIREFDRLGGLYPIMREKAITNCGRNDDLEIGADEQAGNGYSRPANRERIDPLPMMLSIVQMLQGRSCTSRRTGL